MIIIDSKGVDQCGLTPIQDCNGPYTSMAYPSEIYGEILIGRKCYVEVYNEKIFS